MVTVRFTRDSVCMADDMHWPNETSIAVDGETVAVLANSIEVGRHLAGISGGLATWILRCDHAEGMPLAVLAQQWERPRYLVPEDGCFLDLVTDREAPGAFAQYCGQRDPEGVYRALRDGEPLPDR